MVLIRRYNLGRRAIRINLWPYKSKFEELSMTNFMIKLIGMLASKSIQNQNIKYRNAIIFLLYMGTD
jgi:hypothetical protein